jgi:predicted membrane chloride channel (bestrophin family)
VPRYFFHMVALAYRIDDPFGADFPDLPTAGLHAVRIARDLQDEVGSGAGWQISVTDERDRKLLEVTPDGEIRTLPPSI